MKIAITSDIHLFPRWADQVHQLADILEQHEPDVMILAGDTGEPLEMFNEGLRIFKRVAPTRAALAGNHDVWHRVGDYTSSDLWHVLLARAARSHGYTWLDNENMLLNNLGICGSIAWYDYGARADHLQFDEDFYQTIKKKVSNDANYVDWAWTDREFAAEVGKSFLHRLDALEHDSTIANILVVTHVPLFKECVKPVDNLLHGISNAYYANVELGERVITRQKVRAIVSGHVHQERRLTIQPNKVNGATGSGIFVITNPADYGHPSALLLDTNTWSVEVVRVSHPQPTRVR